MTPIASYVPQFYNCDSIGYRYDLVATIAELGLVTKIPAGRFAVLDDNAGWTRPVGWPAISRSQARWRSRAATTSPTRSSNQVIDFLVARRSGPVSSGRSRKAIGQCTNLLASGEAWITDAWNPVVENVKKQDVVCKYAFPEEGFTAWYHGIAVQKDTPNLEVALDYINFCLEGWWGSPKRHRRGLSADDDL